MVWTFWKICTRLNFLRGMLTGWKKTKPKYGIDWLLTIDLYLGAGGPKGRSRITNVLKFHLSPKYFRHTHQFLISRKVFLSFLKKLKILKHWQFRMETSNDARMENTVRPFHPFKDSQYSLLLFYTGRNFAGHFVAHIKSWQDSWWRVTESCTAVFPPKKKQQPRAPVHFGIKPHFELNGFSVRSKPRWHRTIKVLPMKISLTGIVYNSFFFVIAPLQNFRNDLNWNSLKWKCPEGTEVIKKHSSATVSNNLWRITINAYQNPTSQQNAL